MERSGSSPDDRELRHLGEFGLIARLTGGLEPGPGVEAGVGDDAAVRLPTPGHRLVVTTDVLVEWLDITAELSEPEDWGWKAVAANLSDLAAMAAEARWLVLALTVPEATPVPTLERVYAGVGEACRTFGVSLVGGDVSAGPALSLAVTARWGRPPPGWSSSAPGTRRPRSCWAASPAWPPPTAGPSPPWPWASSWPGRGRRPWSTCPTDWPATPSTWPSRPGSGSRSTRPPSLSPPGSSRRPACSALTRSPWPWPGERTSSWPPLCPGPPTSAACSTAAGSSPTRPSGCG